MLTAQRRMCATVAGALSETAATVSLRTKRMLSMFRLRNKKCSETGPNRRCSGPEQYQKQFRFNLYQRHRHLCMSRTSSHTSLIKKASRDEKQPADDSEQTSWRPCKPFTDTVPSTKCRPSTRSSSPVRRQQSFISTLAGRLQRTHSHGLANFLCLVAVSTLPQQSLLKLLHFACWYAIDNYKYGKTGVILNCYQFSEFISHDPEKNSECLVSREALTYLVRTSSITMVSSARPELCMQPWD